MRKVTFWNLVDLDRNQVYYHAVRGNTFTLLQRQAEDGKIVLWGRNEDEDDEWRERGKGEVSCSDFDGLQMSIDNFYDEDGIIFIMSGEKPEKFNSEEYIVTIPEWKIIGGIRPTADEEVFEYYTMGEMLYA